MWFEADTDVTVPVDYEVDGEFLVPDSATFKVRAHDGTLLDSGSMSVASTSETISVSAADNEISAPWENRYVVVDFVSGVNTYTKRVSYQLSEFVPMTASEEAVRALLGLNEEELPNRDVRLYESYFQLESVYGNQISAALLQTGARNAAINEAIAVKSALLIVDSMPLRAMITVRSENTSAARSRDIDFDALKDKLEARLAPLIDTARDSRPAATILFDFSNPGDLFPE